MNISNWKFVVWIRESKGVVVLSVDIARKVGKTIPSRALLSYITGKGKWSTSALIGFAFWKGGALAWLLSEELVGSGQTYSMKSYRIIIF